MIKTVFTSNNFYYKKGKIYRKIFEITFFVNITFAFYTFNIDSSLKRQKKT